MSVWAQENRTERLREMWADGWSASMIGRALGVSRDAVIGKARRLALPHRRQPRSRMSMNRRRTWSTAVVARTLYWEHGLSLAEVAERIGYADASGVWGLFVAWDIPRRRSTRSAAQSAVR